jgi:hypothetical protein
MSISSFSCLITFHERTNVAAHSNGPYLSCSWYLRDDPGNALHSFTMAMTDSVKLNHPQDVNPNREKSH